jgi:tryptophan 7-halogenase
VDDSINTVVIVGGGSAGWLTAGLLAAEYLSAPGSGLEVVLVESPEVSPIGVGEGTWPTMRRSLKHIGVSESEFIRQCGASFKQGTLFKGWVSGKGDSYYHPFSPPTGFGEIDLARQWQAHRGEISFVDAVSPQGRVCDQSLAPKQIVTPEYASNLNYGYHLDAGRFAEFLRQHCTENLGVVHLLENVQQIENDEQGYIRGLRTSSGQFIDGDLFVDCTGARSLILGDHYGVPFNSLDQVLFNDRALAVQLPRSADDEPIASATLSTARSEGWIWDIGLPARRGIGYTYSSSHCEDTAAERVLREYLSSVADPRTAEAMELRQIRFRPGHRESLWHKNCVAIGLSAGFVEPLEASALVMIELSAKMLSEQLPRNRRTMEAVARRFNEKFLYHWQRITEFLKLHYCISKRDDSDYWRDHRRSDTLPPGLEDSLELWRYRSPSHSDLPHVDELFSSASYQYVLYGMGFESQEPGPGRQSDLKAERLTPDVLTENRNQTRKMIAALPGNRELIDKVIAHGFQRV